MAIKLLISNTRVSFANGLFTASALEEGQQKKYGADFILQDDSTVYEVDPVDSKKRTKTTLKAAELKVANEAWKGKGEAMLKSLEASKRAIRDGDLRLDKSGAVRDGYEGRQYVTAKNVQRPTVVNNIGEPVTEEDGTVYSGCVVHVMLSLYANTEAKKKGVFASLQGVRFARDSDRFGGGGVARADEFDGLEEDADDIA